MSIFTGLAYAGFIVATRGGGGAARRARLAVGRRGRRHLRARTRAFSLRSSSRPPRSVAAVRESGVVVATALAAVFLRERVTVWRAGGAALVVAGVALLCRCRD